MQNKIDLIALIVTAIGSIFVPALFGAFGSGTRYLHDVIQNKSLIFNLIDFLYYLFVGAFVGILIHYSMDEFYGKSFSAIILFGGLLSIDIISLIRKNGLDFVLRKLNIKNK